MRRSNNLVLLLFCLATTSCVKDSSWTDYIEKFSSANALKEYAEVEKRLGPDNPDTWWYLNKVGESFHREAKYDKAELYYKRANTAAEKALGHGYCFMPKSVLEKNAPPLPNSDDVPPKSLDNLARLYQTEGKYPDAEMLYSHWAKLLEQKFGPSDRGVALCLRNLAELYREEGLHKQADNCQEKADAIENIAASHQKKTN